VKDRIKFLLILALLLLPLEIAVPISVVHPGTVKIDDNLRSLAARQGVAVEALVVSQPTLAFGVYAECVWIVVVGLATFHLADDKKMMQVPGEQA
jgi:hypothetical protein